MARNDAVRLDLKDTNRANDRDGDGVGFGGETESVKAAFVWSLSSNSALDNTVSRRGWSEAQSSGSDTRRYFFSEGLLGLNGEKDPGELDGESKSWSSDGVDSVDKDRPEKDAISLSLPVMDILSASSGGLSKRSNAEFPVPASRRSSSTSSINILLKSST